MPPRYCIDARAAWAPAAITRLSSRDARLSRSVVLRGGVLDFIGARYALAIDFTRIRHFKTRSDSTNLVSEDQDCTTHPKLVCNRR